jgi:hypothetical protein
LATLDLAPRNRLAGRALPDRGARVTGFLNGRTYAIVDELVRVAKELATTPAAIALAWVQSRPGVRSTIIGARRIDQLDQNLAALDLSLTPDHTAALNRVSEPTLIFPTAFQRMAGSIMHAGATVNGEASQALPLWKDAPAKRYCPVSVQPRRRSQLLRSLPAAAPRTIDAAVCPSPSPVRPIAVP